MKDKLRNFVYYIFASIAAVYPFIITYNENEGKDSYRPVLISSPQDAEILKNTILYIGILLIIIAASKFVKLNEKEKKTARGLGVFFALCEVFGKSYSQTASWDYIFSSVSCFAASAVSIAGYSVLLYYAVGAVITFINNYSAVTEKNDILKTITEYTDRFLEKRSLVKIWLVLLICWLPYIIINYPAIVHADSGVMLGEYMNHSLWNHHPVVQTVIWGSFVKFFQNITGTQNLGVFLFALIQYFYGAFIFALLINYVYKKGYPAFLVAGMSIIMALMPAFGRNVTSICKDSNYSLYVMLMVWLMLVTIDNKDKISDKKLAYYFGWIGVIMLVVFSRKNGIHLVVPSVICLLIYVRDNKKALTTLTAAFITAFVLFAFGNYLITDVFEITNDDTQETLSIPFQQTARYVRDFGDEVTDRERDIIDKVLDYNAFAEKYNPELSDPVKSTFRGEGEDGALGQYFIVWFRQFLKHPGVYIQATVNNIYGYFYIENVGYYKDMFYMSQCVDDRLVFAPEGLKKASEWLCDVNMKTRQIPVIGLLSGVGFYVWLEFFIIFYFIFIKRNNKILTCNIPVLLSLLICIASPANNTMRYALPIIFITPVLFCMCFESKDTEVKK